MKKIIFLSIIIIAASCSRKTVPAKSSNGTIIYDNDPSNNNSNETITTDTVSELNNSSSLAFIIVTDGFGKIINRQQSLPTDADVHFNELQLSKGFTAQQRLNLKTRYKTIPPRVIYVNPQNHQSSARGSFYVLGKKFWYWKKKDGLFYLDEKYYQ